MKGKWAKGIAPRFFCWIIKDKLAVSERPGGYARNHRRVRRQEEILWLRGEGFTRVVSLLTSPHNLHAYDELDMAWAQVPFAPADDPHQVLPDLYAQLRDWMASGERLLVHQEELSDRVMGVVAGYLRWSGLVPEGPQAITVVERIMHRQMGPEGRELVALAPQLAGAGRCGGPATVKAKTSEDTPRRSKESVAAKAAAREAAAVAASSVGPWNQVNDREPAPSDAAPAVVPQAEAAPVAREPEPEPVADGVAAPDPASDPATDPAMETEAESHADPEANGASAYSDGDGERQPT